METLETQETKMPPQNKSIGFYKKHKKHLLIGVLAIVVIVLGWIFTGVINNAVLTNRVQSYLDGKMFIERDGIWTVAYAFDKNTMAQEHWCSSDQNSSGDINEGFRYKVTGALGGEEVQLWYKENGNWMYGPDVILCEDGSVKLRDGEWSLVTREDINTIRKETLCKHELGKKVTIKAATCSSGGETSRTCKKCGYSETQYTAALEHTYKEKVCTECGAKAAPKDFIFGTFTKQGFVNEWMNLKFTPYNNMYSNPKTVIASYEASLNNPQYEFDAMEIMEYYVREGTSSNGLASVLVQKLKKTTTAEDYLEDNMREIEDAFRPYPQISVVRGEKGVYELCGEEYEYQKFSVVGGVSGTFHSMFLYRILDGYAINIQIQEGYYTIEEQLDCFEAIN